MNFFIAGLLVFALSWPFSILLAALVTSVKPRSGQGDSWTAAALFVGIAALPLFARHIPFENILSALHMSDGDYKTFQWYETLIASFSVVLLCSSGLGTMTQSDVIPIDIYPGALPFFQEIAVDGHYANTARFRLWHPQVKLALLLKPVGQDFYEMRATSGDYDLTMGTWIILNLSYLDEQLLSEELVGAQVPGQPVRNPEEIGAQLVMPLQDATKQFTAKIRLNFATRSYEQFRETREGSSRVPRETVARIRDEYVSNLRGNLIAAISDMYGAEVIQCLDRLYSDTAKRLADREGQSRVANRSWPGLKKRPAKSETPLRTRSNKWPWLVSASTSTPEKTSRSSRFRCENA